MATTTRLSAIEAALPSDALSLDVHGYEVDGAPPLLVAKPTSEDEVAATLRAASESDAAVVALGSRRHLGLGMPPSRYDVALDMTKLDRILEYSPADLMVSVEAGVLLSELEKTLAEKGQWLPLDPADDGTIGGMLAANRSGPARMSFGSARDLVIGMKVVTATGDVIKSGGRVVKNVAGYDLAKLHIGAIGTLGVITSATFKVAPLPVEMQEVAFTGTSQSLMSTALEIRNRGLAVTGLTLSNSLQGWQLLVRIAGGHAAVARSRRDAELLASRVGATVAEAVEPPTEGVVIARASLPPTSVEAVAESIASNGASVVSYPLTGTVRGYWQDAPSAADLASLRGISRVGGGAFVIEAAPVELKQQIDTWGEPGVDFELMRRLKQQFDPKGTLSPGRFVGDL